MTARKQGLIECSDRQFIFAFGVILVLDLVPSFFRKKGILARDATTTEFGRISQRMQVSVGWPLYCLTLCLFWLDILTHPKLDAEWRLGQYISLRSTLLDFNHNNFAGQWSPSAAARFSCTMGRLCSSARCTPLVAACCIRQWNAESSWTRYLVLSTHTDLGRSMDVACKWYRKIWRFYTA